MKKIKQILGVVAVFLLVVGCYSQTLQAKELTNSEMIEDSNMELYGQAKFLDDDSIQLTPLETNSSGCVWYPHSVDTTQDFSITVSYWIGGGRELPYEGADGMILGFTEKKGIGSNGEYQGFVSGEKSYGVELDSYPYNRGDPDGKHIAIIKNNVRNHLKYVLDDRVDDSAWHKLSVSYKAKEKTLTVYLDEKEVLASDGIELSQKCYLGISAATASGCNQHLIKNISIDGKIGQGRKIKYSIKDTYSFVNLTDKIPEKIYTKKFGQLLGRALRTIHDGTAGQCYGMAATVAASAEYNSPAASSYVDESNKKVENLFDVKPDMKSLQSKVTASEYIKCAFLEQIKPGALSQRLFSVNQLNKLYNKVKENVYNDGEPVIIEIQDGGGHALLATGTGEDTEEQTEILVYDCNYPKTMRSLYLLKNEKGKYKGWQYKTPYKEYSGGENYLGGLYDDKYISYNTTTKKVIQSFENYKGGKKEKIDTYALIKPSKTKDDIELLKGYKGSLELEKIGKDESIIPISVVTGNSDDCVGQYYWVNNDKIKFKSNTENSSYVITSENIEVGMAVPKNSEATVDISKKNTPVSLKLSGDRKFEIEYTTTDNKENIILYKIQGIGGEEVSCEKNGSEIDITGVKNIETTISIGDKEISKNNISDLSEGDTYILNVNDNTFRRTEKIENNNVNVDVDIDGESSERHLISDTAKGNGMTHKSGNTWGTIIIKDADYKGKIKAKPTDMSGNTASKYTEPRGVISETQSQHNKAKTMKITTLTKPSNTANGINYYNRSVAVNISMGDSHSGLKSWGYTAGTAVKDNKNYGEAAGTTDKNGNPTVNNVYSMNKTVTMAAGDTNYTNKDNPTMVETEFEDNAGWTEKANEKYVIDDKKPIIKVDWTSSANVMNEKYYKATRVAHITVTERNFNEAGVDWQINNETGVVKSGWSHNGDTHTCDVSFTKDGDFILNFKITDYAMNSDSYKGEEFTIDKTAPVISISFDRNNPSNGYYFNTPRTATLHIEEHNFAAKDVTYELSGSNDGKGIGSPTAGGWSTGSDHHTASIYYGSDGEFSLNFNYTDMAGNPANKIQTEKFVIDLTKPVCKITNVEDHAAYNGKVAPGIEYSDTNLDENQVTVKLVGNKVGNASYEKNAPVSIHNGRTVQWKDFARKEKVDDIYTMELTIKDKAGNESTDKKVFSVNRFGSNYIFGTDTQALLDKIYSNQEIPVEVREINVNSLKEKAISVKNEDNEITELQAGSDYTVTEGNDKYKWKEYRYVINGDVFAQESEYNVTLSSKDAAANEMNNVAKNKDIDFIIDKTNPTGIVSGLEESSYKEDSHKINVRAMDNYQLDEAVLYVDGSEYKTFASEDFQGDKGVEVTLDSKNKPQEIYLSLTDKAGNSVDLKKTQCLITSNAWIQYINNKPLFYSTVGGGAALIIAILGIATRGFGYASSMAAQSGFWWTILGKRREDEDED